MKTHYREKPDAETICGRTPKAVAQQSADWTDVTCKWCLKKRLPDTAEQARLLLEALKNPIPLQITNLFSISWEPAPEGFDCPRCNARLERTKGLMLSSPWSGAVRCTGCEYRDSVTGYVGRSMIKVEPLPEGANPVYLNEPE